MPPRALRATRIGRTSYETERTEALAPRRSVTYRCTHDHEFPVPLADDALPPATWDCRQHGTDAALVGEDAAPPKPTKPARTHWDMLLERRSVEELDVILTERLAALSARRTAHPAPAQQQAPTADDRPTR